MAVSANDKIVRGGDLATIGAQVKAKLAEKVSSENIDNMLYLTSAEYGAIETKDPNTIYVVTDGGAELYPQDGKSAYQIWLEQGNVGTESDFLASLQGNSGYSGAAGELEVVNNLTQGGTESALSAEMGKLLNNNFSNINADINGGEGVQDVLIEQDLTANKYYNVSGTLPNSSGTLEGCYCSKISVSEGEEYKITGYRNDNAASRLYATFSSDGTRIRYCVTSSSGVRQSFNLTIEENEAYLVVNLKDYDSAVGDGFWKVTEESVIKEGLNSRVQVLENKDFDVLDSLVSDSTSNALSANKGRVLNEEINGITTESFEDQEVLENKYFNTANSRVPAISNIADASGTSCVYIYASPGEVYRIYGKGDSGSHQLYALADSNRYVIENGIPGAAMNTRVTPLDITIPEGVAILVVNLYQYDSNTDKVQKINYVTSDCIKTRLSDLENASTSMLALALPLNGKRVMFFGDSITDYTYNQKGLVNYFAEASVATCFKAAVGGARFVQRTTPVETPTTSTQAYAALDICNMVKAWCEADYTKQDAATTYLGDHSARVSALKNNPISTIDIVCIGGGTNDMSGNSPIGNDTDNTFDTIKGAINKIIELLLTANPGLKIYFYSPVVGYHGSGGRTDANWDDNYKFSSGKTKPEYIDILSETAKNNHIPYINLYWTLGWNQLNFSNYFLDTDDHHPYKGFDVIGRRLYHQVLSNIE